MEIDFVVGKTFKSDFVKKSCLHMRAVQGVQMLNEGWTKGGYSIYSAPHLEPIRYVRYDDELCFGWC